MKKIIESSKVPDAIGPYSQAVEAGGFLMLSGQLPISKKSGMPKGIESQTRQSLENVKYILDERKLTLNDVVEVTVYLKDIKDFSAMNGIYATYFLENYPARCAFEVANLPANALVEIKVTALLNK